MLDEPWWDRKAVRGACDINGVLERLVGCFGSLKWGSGEEEESERGMGMGGESERGIGIDMGKKLAWIFEKAGVWVRGKLAVLDAKDVATTIYENDGNLGYRESGPGDGDRNDRNSGVSEEFRGEDVAMNGVDDVWLSEIFGPWTYDFM